MKLFIRLQNGVPYEHPILEDNFIKAFPDIDINSLPEGFARFERIAPPVLKPYEVYVGVTYEFDNGIVKDVHHVRDMTSEEKYSFQENFKQEWAISGHPSWVFNEEKCVFEPPIPYPNDGLSYVWDEATTSWVQTQPTE